MVLRFEKKRKPVNREETRSFSTSTVIYKENKGNNNKKEEEKHEPICSGCPGVREALSNVKKKKEIIKCRKRPGGKCPGPTKEHGPLDPPILSPYWKCKSPALSKCNQPRPAVVKKERTYKLPCEPDHKKLHTLVGVSQICLNCEEECAPPGRRTKKLTPLDIPRESCFDKKYPKKEKEKKGGFLCKLASLFGIGCGKKKDCM